MKKKTEINLLDPNTPSLTERISNDLDFLLGKVMSENDIHTGDINPEQAGTWDKLCSEVKELFITLLVQNTQVPEKIQEDDDKVTEFLEKRENLLRLILKEQKGV